MRIISWSTSPAADAPNVPSSSPPRPSRDTSNPNSEGNNGNTIIHRLDHLHQHYTYNYYNYHLHVDQLSFPQNPLQNRLQITDVPTLLPVPQQGTHISNPLPAQPNSRAVASITAVAGPSGGSGSRSGRKKALCIGINYIGQDRPLLRCINDASDVRNFLIEHHGYSRDNIILLTDAGSTASKPTKDNIRKYMHWLVKDARRGDSLFFHFSGLGGQVQDKNGNGFDEAIYPVDYHRSGKIVDEDMHEIMIKPLPSGCLLTAFFDSFHSGTPLDLPYIYSSTGHLKNDHLSRRTAGRRSAADVVSWAASQDGETNRDKAAKGAMSHAFINILKKNPKLSYKELLMRLNEQLRHQKPQLSSSHKIDTNDQFII